MPGRAERLLITDAVVVTMNDANDVHFGGAIATGQVKLDDEEEAEFEGEDVEQSQEQATAMMMAGIVLPQIHQFLDVAAALRSVSGVTYHEDGAWVTHGEIHIQDLESEKPPLPSSNAE